ncbi:MAG: SGNH/GDSL hydrolase family protein, partial [Nocardioidaceae bacterium]
GRHGGSPELRVHGIPGATWQRLGDAAATGGHGPVAQRSRHGRSAQSTHGQGRAPVHHVAASHGRPGHHAAGRQYLGGRHHSSRPAPVAGKDITAIGDSVMVAAAPALEQRLQGLYIDAEIGRQMWDVAATVAALKRAGHLRRVVVIGLGSNGAFTSDQLGAALQEIGPHRRVVLVNTHVPRPWQDSVNATLTSLAAEHRNVTVVDWNTAISQHPGWLYSDDIHPDPDGGALYANLLATALHVR